LLPVIARNSSFAYKGQAVDVKQVSRELGARYVLGGSVQRAESRLRVTAQLLDAKDRTHLWAGKYEPELSAPDIFAIQDEIAEQVAGTIAGLFGVVHR
jgi:TolB-like protein